MIRLSALLFGGLHILHELGNRCHSRLYIYIYILLANDTIAKVIHMSSFLYENVLAKLELECALLLKNLVEKSKCVKFVLTFQNLEILL